MEEVEETKCKGGARSNASRWKPANTKELATTGGRIVFAQTVLDSYRVDAQEVEQCKQQLQPSFYNSPVDKLGNFVKCSS